MPKVSVVTPTYNRDKYIKKCIDSILNQTLSDIELILVDDGSTDNTSNIVSTYNDPRLKYFKRENHGIGASRNFGIDKSLGEYILFVDSDDFIESNALEKMYNKAMYDDLDILVSDYYNIYQDGRLDNIHLESFDNTTLKDKPELLLTINLGPCNKLFKRDLFDNKELRFPEDIKYEDMPLVSHLFKCSKKLGKIDEALCYFLVDNVSETTVRDERVFDIFKSLKLTLSYLYEEEYKDTLKELVISKLCNYNIQQRYQKNRKTRHKFINDSFIFMKSIDSKYKKNNYFKTRNKLKGFIEKHKLMTILYCDIYRIIKG